MSLAARLRRERTNASSKPNLVYNAPGNFLPPYGKSKLYVSGRGQAGNAPVAGTVASYNPASGGNYAGTNAGSGGNVAGYNPYSPGYTAYNPPTASQTVYTQTWGPGAPAPTTYTSGYFAIEPSSSFNPDNGWYTEWTVDRGGTAPGNAYYVPATGGDAYYNPYYPGNAYYNPYYPSTANYNPPSPGNAGTPFSALGVYFPGGPAGQSAPLIGPVPVNVPYQNSPVAVPVPTGAYVSIAGS